MRLSDEAKTLLPEVDDLYERIRPLMAGHESAVQGAVLAQLLATWMAGHRTNNRDLRKLILRAHIRAVWGLIPHIDARIDRGGRKKEGLN